MARDVFDAYKLIVDDTNELGNRRQTVDTVYESIVTLVLGADGYIAALGQFQGVVPIAATAAIGVVGIIFTTHWRNTVDKLKRVLNLRYEYLRHMEEDPDLQSINAQVYSKEWQDIYAKREATRKKTGHSRTLQSIFTGIFIVLPIMVLALTILAKIPETHAYISPLIPATHPGQ